MLSLSTFVTRLSWLPVARSKAQFTCRAACWSSVPTPKAHTTILLCIRRALGARRKDAARARLQVSLNKDTPIRRAIQHVGRIVSAPVLGGLHHHYCRI